MKKQWLLASWMISVSLSSLVAATTLDTKTITMSVTVKGVSTFVSDIRKIADNSPDTNISFDTIEVSSRASFILPKQYIALRVDDNAFSWNLRVYTDNFETQPSTDPWGYQYGGLKGSQPGSRIYMSWMTSPAVIPNGPKPTNPGKYPVYDYRGRIIREDTAPWLYLKDKSDINIPNSENGDSSFEGSGGYTNIAFGSVSWTRIVRPDEGPQTIHPVSLLNNPTDEFYLYLNGAFYKAAAGEYTGQLKLELQHQ